MSDNSFSSPSNFVFVWMWIFFKNPFRWNVFLCRTCCTQFSSSLLVGDKRTSRHLVRYAYDRSWKTSGQIASWIFLRWCSAFRMEQTVGQIEKKNPKIIGTSEETIEELMGGGRGGGGGGGWSNHSAQASHCRHSFCSFIYFCFFPPLLDAAVDVLYDRHLGWIFRYIQTVGRGPLDYSISFPRSDRTAIDQSKRRGEGNR